MKKIGKVIWFGGYNNNTGTENNFGFIEDQDGSRIFVHKNQIQQSNHLTEGVYVTFTLGTNPKKKNETKLEAQNVLLLSNETDIDIIIQCFSNKDLWQKVINNLTLLPTNQALELVTNKLNSITNYKDKAYLLNHISDSFLLLPEASHLYDLLSTHRWVKVIDNLTLLPTNQALELLTNKLNSINDKDKLHLLNRVSESILLLPEASHLYDLLPMDKLIKVIDNLALLSTNQALERLTNKLNSVSDKDKLYLFDYVSESLLLLPEASHLYDLLPTDKLVNLYKKGLSVDYIIDKAHTFTRTHWQEINIEYGSKLFALAPATIKKPILEEYFSNFIKPIANFKLYPKCTLTWSPKSVYGQHISETDIALAELWMSGKKDNIFDKARMVSARCAELVSMQFYRELGYTTVDISATQLHHHSNDWKLYDILLDDKIAIDVKNSRTPIHSERYVEHCIPRFKENRSHHEIIIAGVISPYLSWNYMTENDISFPIAPIKFIGETTLSKIQELEQLFCRDNIKITIYSNFIVPPWVFDYPSHFYNHQAECHKLLRGLELLPTVEELNILNINPIPYFLAAGANLPSIWNNLLSEWQHDFYNRLHSIRKKGRISLPTLFLSILTHFLEMIHQDNYDPKGYINLIFNHNPSDKEKEFPLGIYDSLKITDKFCSTLSTLWKYNNESKLHEFVYFRFAGLGLLQGKRQNSNKLETILAYCGGWIEEKGKCGNNPLVIGVHKNCPECGKLICSLCGFCSDNCSAFILRKEESKKQEI